MTDAATSPLPVLGIWHRDGARYRNVGEIAAYSSLSFEELATGVGTWSCEIPAGTPHVDKITGAALVTCDWLDHRWGTGRTTTPGVETADTAAAQEGSPRIVVKLAGETGLSLFGGVMCAPDPDDPGLQADPPELAAQPARKVYAGAAGLVIRQLVDEQYRGLRGETIILPPATSLGSDVREIVQYTDLLTHVLAASAAGKVAASVGLVNTSGAFADLTLGLRQVADESHRAILSTALGSLAQWAYGDTRPTLTRAWVGGGGSGPTRVWRVVTTAQSVAAAEAWGGHVDGYVDGQGSFDNVELDRIGVAAIEQALGGQSFSVTASTAPGMRIWERAKLGDTIAVELTDTITTTEPLQGLRLTVGNDERVKVTPLVGDPDATTPERRLGRLVRDVVRRVRVIETTRRPA